MSKNPRSQSAMEYLTTYSWTMLVIAVVIVAIYYLGVLNPNSSVSQECVFTSTLSCLRYQISSNGLLSFNIEQTSLDTLSITSMGCSANATSLNMAAPSSAIIVAPNENFTYSLICYAQNGQAYSNPAGSVFSGVLEINYSDTQTGLPSSQLGKIVVKVAQ